MGDEVVHEWEGWNATKLRIRIVEDIILGEWKRDGGWQPIDAELHEYETWIDEMARLAQRVKELEKELGDISGAANKVLKELEDDPAILHKLCSEGNLKMALEDARRLDPCLKPPASC